MKVTSTRTLVGSALLLLLVACSNQPSTAAPPAPGSAELAVDLGGSARISRIAGSPGEGEGYDTVQAISGTHTTMAGMTQAAGVPVAKASMPAADHSAMGHGAMSASPQAVPAAPQVAQATQVQGTGTVNAVDAAGHKVTLSHNAIPAIGWPAMTMEFAAAHSVNLGALKPGTRVSFTMTRGGDGMYVIQSIAPAGGQ